MRLVSMLAALAAAVVAIPTSHLQEDAGPDDLVSLFARDAPKVALLPGTAYLNHSDIDLPHMRGQGLGKYWNQYPGIDTFCFSDVKDDGNSGNSGNKCWGIDGHWALTAVDKFCRAMDGQRLDITQSITSYSMIFDYWPSARVWDAEHGKIKLQVGFAENAPTLDPPAYTMDYEFCVQQGFLLILSYCDNKGINHKRGGYSDYNNTSHGNDRLFCLLDPNPIEGHTSRDPMHIHSYGRDRCFNRDHYWLPSEDNTKPFDAVIDDCRAHWVTTVSLVETMRSTQKTVGTVPMLIETDVRSKTGSRSIRGLAIRHVCMDWTWSGATLARRDGQSHADGRVSWSMSECRCGSLVWHRECWCGVPSRKESSVGAIATKSRPMRALELDQCNMLT